MCFFKRKKRQEPAEPLWAVCMSKFEFDSLCRYNTRVSQGIVHTEEYKNRMARLQEIFNYAEG